MNDENTKILIETFPELFRKKEFYFQCGDGWFDLLHYTCRVLKSYAGNDEAYIHFTQVKEKFGLLRIYIDCGCDANYQQAWGVTTMAEAASALICEECGERSKLQNHSGWLSTLCDRCIKKDY